MCSSDLFTHLAFIGPGGPEILVVMLVLLLMFGAKDAPRIFRKLNDMLNQFRSTAESFKREVMYSDLSSEPKPDRTAGEYADYGVGSHDDEEASTEESGTTVNGERPADSDAEPGSGAETGGGVDVQKN